MLNEKFWLAISFTTFILLLIKFVRPQMTKALDDKSKAIGEEIMAAKEMKERAIQLLAKAEKYSAESASYAQKLIQDAEAEAQKFSAEARQMLDQEISKKTAASIERIKLEEIGAIRDIKTKIVAAAMENLSENIAAKMDQKNHGQLIDRATQDFEKVI